ncbi:MAG: methylated-DNA--[protein]-cysteine S-methyltransferase, partial [Granulosicoccus sp.]|nr:methylated-DNA--[protein]-cysteine S-methyltransferase [Granulosicoccus sp.]
MQIYYTQIPSPVGEFLIAGTTNAVCRTAFHTKNWSHYIEDSWQKEAAPLGYAIEQFQDYFAGQLVEFTLAHELSGTEFQLSVWEALKQVGYGTTVSYGDIARAIDKPGAQQAVGAANGANPLPILVPCHRIIGTDGSMTGFGGGIEIKQKLLHLEGVTT